MSNAFNYRSGAFMIRQAPIGSGVLAEPGDQLMISGTVGKVTRMLSASNNLAFAGIAASKHAATDGSGVLSIYIPLPTTVFEVDLDAATDVVFGGQLQFYSTQKLKVSTTDAIASAVESKLAATKALVVYKLPQHTNGLKLVGDAS